MSSKQRLEGKAAIVTGAASGIGAEAAKLFSQNGASVVIADVEDELGLKLAASIGSDKVIYRHFDVRDEKQVAQTLSLALDKFGRLDIMFSNAGIAGSFAGILELDLSAFDNTMAVNVRGVAATIEHAARAIMAGNINFHLNTAIGHILPLSFCLGDKLVRVENVRGMKISTNQDILDTLIASPVFFPSIFLPRILKWEYGWVSWKNEEAQKTNVK